MQTILGPMRDKARELLSDGRVDQVLGWKAGEFYHDPTPAFFTDTDSLEGLVYNSFCASNLSKYLIGQKNKDAVTAVFLKPCDTYSFNQLFSEHRIDRDKVYVIGVGCDGMLDPEKIRAQGIKGVQSMEETGEELLFKTLYGSKQSTRKDLLLEKCLCCKGIDHMVYDELIGADESVFFNEVDCRFERVREVEEMTPDQRFDFWRGELSKCIRCNACRNICPACSCIQCVFDNSRSGVSAKANANDFEENLFHIIRAYHVAGRCTDCGECSRVCPQGIPLHLLNRKLIKDVANFFGPFQPGATAEACSPLTQYSLEDVEPGIVSKQGGMR